ncbi:Chitinase 1 [Gryganskiella cystojenkinii]|nr:Chitinase 1 [Gryganskiella cystojenkinii]
MISISDLPSLVFIVGDSSYGAAGGDMRLWQKPLAEYCQTSEAEDVIVLAFLHVFNSASRQLPRMDLSNQCRPSSVFAGTGLLHCPETAAGVRMCQSHGKAVILSLGGAAGAYGFADDTEARDFAHMIWNLFLGGSSVTRPLDDAILDGVDLDIEGGSSVGYPAFIAELRSLFSTDARKQYYITAAPQCPFPDAYLGATLQSAWIDMVFVQYYNNYCGAQAYGSFSFNFDQWDHWAKTVSVNKDVKVFLGVPASAKAANAGYVTIERLGEIMDAVRCKYSSFGGVMMWDLSQAYGNIVEQGTGTGYSVAAARHLKRPRHIVCGGSPDPEPTSRLSPSPVRTPPVPAPPVPKPPIPAPPAPVPLVPTSLPAPAVPLPPVPVFPVPAPAPAPVPVSAPAPVPQVPVPLQSPLPPPLAPAKPIAIRPDLSISSSQCPVDGTHCDPLAPSQGFICDGFKFGICDNNRWILQKCAPGTYCTPTGCDYIPRDKKVKSCQEQEQEARALRAAEVRRPMRQQMREALDQMWDQAGEFVDTSWESFLGLDRTGSEGNDRDDAGDIKIGVVEEADSDTTYFPMPDVADDAQKPFVVPLVDKDAKDSSLPAIQTTSEQQQDSQPFLIDFVELDASEEFISFSVENPEELLAQLEEYMSKEPNAPAPNIAPFRTQVRIRTNNKAISPLWRVSFNVRPGQVVKASTRGKFKQEGQKVIVTSVPELEAESSMVIRFVVEGIALSEPIMDASSDQQQDRQQQEGVDVGEDNSIPEEDIPVGGDNTDSSDVDSPDATTDLDMDGKNPTMALSGGDPNAWSAESAKFDTIPLHL